MPEIVHEIVLVLTVVVILLIIIHIFLDYKWKLDILHKIDIFYGEVNQRYRNDNTSKLTSITDEVNRLSKKWNDTRGSTSSIDHEDSRELEIARALDDLLGKYGS